MKKIIIIIKISFIFIVLIFLLLISLLIKEMKEESRKINSKYYSNRLIYSMQNENKSAEKKDRLNIKKPTFGEEYAKLKIDSIDIELPIYYGADYNILKKGIGHDNSSYFPGEGGSIILAGHNYKRLLANLPNVKINDQITIQTNYDIFNYNVYNTKIIHETEKEKVPIQKEEILMIYTCYPINNIGHSYYRFVVYAKKI